MRRWGDTRRVCTGPTDISGAPWGGRTVAPFTVISDLVALNGWTMICGRHYVSEISMADPTQTSTADYATGKKPKVA